MKLKKGDFIETKDTLISISKNLYKEGIKGYIVKPVYASQQYVWIKPTNDDFLRAYALEGHPTGVLKENIIKVNGKEVKEAL